LVLNVLPDQDVDTISRIKERSGLDVRMIPYRQASVDDLNRKALEIMTRDGVEIWTSGDESAVTGRRVYLPLPPDTKPTDVYELVIEDSSQRARLRLHNLSMESTEAFSFPRFEPQALRDGKRFVAWPNGDEDNSDSKFRSSHLRNRLLSLSIRDGAIIFQARGELEGWFVLRPMMLSGRRGYLLSRRRREAS
jgi:hypothetical protein